MEIEKCSEADAKKELERIAEDNQITGQDIDWTGRDKDEPESEDDSTEETAETEEEETVDHPGTKKAVLPDKK